MSERWVTLHRLILDGKDSYLAISSGSINIILELNYLSHCVLIQFGSLVVKVNPAKNYDIMDY